VADLVKPGRDAHYGFGKYAVWANFETLLPSPKVHLNPGKGVWQCDACYTVSGIWTQRTGERATVIIRHLNDLLRTKYNYDAWSAPIG
jgi:hypothetical protein